MRKKHVFLLCLTAILCIVFFILCYRFRTSFKRYVIPPGLRSLLTNETIKFQPASIDAASKKTATIPPEGGTMAIVDGNGITMTLSIPPGGVSQNTDVILSALTRLPIDEGGAENQPGVLIEPIDIQFLEPARLTFAYTPIASVSSDVNIPAVMLPGQTRLTSLAPTIASGTLTPEEENRRGRRSGVMPTFQNGGVVYTNSSPNQPGTIVQIFHIINNDESGVFSTMVTSGGTYTPEEVVHQLEARANLKEKLNDSNATTKEIFDAASLLEPDTLDGLSPGMKEKLKQAMGRAIEELTRRCQEGGAGATQGSLITWETMARTLGFSTEKGKFTKLLDECKGYYTFHLVYTEGSPAIVEYDGSVCGYIDGTWSGSILAKDPTGPCDDKSTCRSTPYTFSFPAGGGPSIRNTGYNLNCHCCAYGNCFSDSIPFSPYSDFIYDGVDTVTLNNTNVTTKLRFSKTCASDALPPLEPISNDQNALPQVEPITPE